MTDIRVRGRARTGDRSLRERLTRRTTGGRLIPAIDGLRFIAIAMVVLFHIDIYTRDRLRVSGGAWLQDLLGRGGNGVHLFFAISGFILGLGFARAAAGTGRAVSIGRYLKRRITRLEPPYIVAMTGMLLAYVVIRHQSLAAQLPHHLVGLIYLHNIVYREANTVNGVAWSLEVEVQFYLLAPLLALAYRFRHAWQRCGILAGLGLAAALAQLLVFDADVWRWDLSLAGHLQYFMVGMILADFVARRPASATASVDDRSALSRGTVLADVAGVSGLVVVLLSQSVIGRALFLPLGAAGCLYGALYGHHVRRWLSRPWVYIIGGMCYSIYLLHIGVISLLGPITTKLHVGTSYLTNVTIQTIALGTATMIVSIVFFLLIERPCMDPDWPSKAADALRRRARRVPA